MTEEEKRLLIETSDRAKSNQHRIVKIEERQDNLDKLVTSVEVLAHREERVESDVKEIKTDVKSLTGKPAKRWEGLINQLITVLVAAISGFILAKIGL